MILIRVRRVSQLQESFPAIKKPKQLEKRKSVSVRVLEKFIGPLLIALICLFPGSSLADEVRVNVRIAIIVHPPTEPDFGANIEGLVFHGFYVDDEEPIKKEGE